MGMNFYVNIKREYEPKLIGIYEDGEIKNGVTTLSNGYVWKNTYFATMEEVNEKYFLHLHIGKSSFGWHFGLCVYPELGIDSLEDWINLWNTPGVTIIDEEDRIISPADMVDRITNRGNPNWDASKQEEFEKKAVESFNTLNASLGNRIYVTNYDEYLNVNCAARGLYGLLAHNSRYYDFPPTGGTYDLTDDPNFS